MMRWQEWAKKRLPQIVETASLIRWIRLFIQRSCCFTSEQGIYFLPAVLAAISICSVMYLPFITKYFKV